MRLFLIIVLTLLLTVPAFSMRFGMGASLLLYPFSEEATRDIDNMNGTWITAKENNTISTRTYEVDEIGKPLGIGGRLRGILEMDMFVTHLSFSYMSHFGGSGKLTQKDGSSTTTYEFEGKASAVTFMGTISPKIEIKKTTFIYLGTGLGYMSATASSKYTEKTDGVTALGASYDREYTSSGFFLPILGGMEIGLSDSLSVGTEILYVSNTFLGKYRGRANLGSAIDTTQTISVDASGVYLFLNFNYYFPL